MFENPSHDEICALLKKSNRIAVVGLSPNVSRPSFGVAKAMQGFGYTIVPVRPKVSEVLGQKAYATLAEVPGSIDIVDVFRAAEHIDAIVEECIALKIPAIWIQDGIINEPAAERARDAGMVVVMDRCIYRDFVGICV
ncbi:CoA-binding protein [Sulfurirhabdus autotrophica]|uniref:CoA-binding domain-containing protein n=1 Tax=Sulfurirhabdus autotrophica TaxID=1706046 RepID=A0A4R3Y0F6_9PROT|nr:CoA-binding protein [Sulfurirhabdus autotrophica]TCV85136.1 hypothetical protein EDC63_11025 [Sulfurirhabdus autotrophica]